eukprot:scaffold19095_cov73-Skeletonema_marinoi.AAC.1
MVMDFGFNSLLGNLFDLSLRKVSKLQQLSLGENCFLGTIEVEGWTWYHRGQPSFGMEYDKYAVMNTSAYLQCTNLSHLTLNWVNCLTKYDEGDRVSVTAAGEDYGKIYECKNWPESYYCGNQAFSPLNTAKLCNSGTEWPVAWIYLGGCTGTGTITPTATPTTTMEPTDGQPTSSPTNVPTPQPTPSPTNVPTSEPTSSPTNVPTPQPTNY